MDPRLAALPSRVRKIVEEEFETGIVWFDGAVPSLEHLLDGTDHKAARVRWAIWYRLHVSEPDERGEKKPSLSQIGRWFGYDHTSVRAAILKFPEFMLDWSLAKQKLYEMQRRQRLLDAARMNPLIKDYEAA